MDIQNTLLAYSEWLDSEGLIVGDDGEDTRTHDDLAREFIVWWHTKDDAAALPHPFTDPSP